MNRVLFWGVLWGLLTGLPAARANAVEPVAAATSADTADIGGVSRASVNSGERFTLLDADQDGALLWEEFSAVNSTITRQGFDLIDKNVDGALSPEEWQAFTSTHGMSVPMPTESKTIPAPKGPTMPLVTPPKVSAPNALMPEPDKPEAVTPKAPAVPGNVRTTAPKGSTVPLVTPPRTPAPARTSSASASGKGIPAPSLPLITPPSSPEKDFRMAPSSGGSRQE